jgi:long-subunit fatty acid transport protein
MAAEASTAAANPAGMTLLDRTQLVVAGKAMLPDINFDRDPQTKVPGAAVTVMLVFSSRSGLRLCLPTLGPSRLSIALVSNFGLASDYSLNWADVLLYDQYDL